MLQHNILIKKEEERKKTERMKEKIKKKEEVKSIFYIQYINMRERHLYTVHI